MSTFILALSIWLHTLATVVFIGHYLFLGLVYLPVFEHQSKGKALRELLEDVSARLRPYFGASLLIFIVTGTYLMMINEAYLGLGEVFGNAWSILIVVKHVLVLAFLVLAIFSERAIMVKISDEQSRVLKQFRLTLYANTVLGLLILLLTTVAQTV
jgi:uncharacterized membrane protein